MQIWMKPSDDIPGRNQTATALRAREIDWAIASADIIVASGQVPRLKAEHKTARHLLFNQRKILQPEPFHI